MSLYRVVNGKCTTLGYIDTECQECGMLSGHGGKPCPTLANGAKVRHPNRKGR